MRRGKKKRIGQADSGALSDLAFLLIIFFIVIAVFNVNEGFMLSLPKKNSKKIVNVNDIISVKLDANGLIEHDNKYITVKDLEADVSDMLKTRPNLTFLLKISPETPYQYVVNIIEIVRKLDVDNFSFKMIES